MKCKNQIYDGVINTQKGSRTIAPEENYPPALILTLTLNQTPTLTGGQFSSGVIVWALHRSSRSQMFFKIGVLKKLANFTGNHLCKSLFYKVAGLKACNFLKNRLQHRCFFVTFTNVLRTAAASKSIFHKYNCKSYITYK